MQRVKSLCVAMSALTLCVGILPAQSTRDSSDILQLYRALSRAVEAGDVNGVMSVMDDSITVLVPGAPPIQGAAAYRTGLIPMFSTAEYRLRLAPPRRLQVAGPWAFVHYVGTFASVPKAGGDSAQAALRYVDILRRQRDGSWRLFLHSFQNDAAAKP